MNREVVVVPEKKKKIEQIKQKYRNLAMSDKDAIKIKNIEVTNSILKTASLVVGVVGVIDIFIPDPIIGLDEAALMAISGLLGTASTMCTNKIDQIAKNVDPSVKFEEITKLGSQLSNVANKVNTSRKTHSHK